MSARSPGPRASIPKTGKPVDYDPTKDLQIYAEPANVNADKVTRRVCPDQSGGNNFWPSSYSPKTKMLLCPERRGLLRHHARSLGAREGQVRRRQLRQPASG